MQEKSSWHAQRGTILHRYVQVAREKGREEALAEISDDELRNQAAAIDLDALPAGAESEVALAYNPVTGEAKRLELTGNRAYPTEPGWLYGTADLIGTDDDCVYVPDLKTGKAVVSAKDSWQLRFLAVAASRLTGKERARVGLLYLQSDGRWHQDWAEFDGFDLDDFASQLHGLYTKIELSYRDYLAGVMPDLSTGSHCRYCKSMSVCPAQTTIVRAFIPTLADLVGKLESMTPEQRGEAYEKYKVAEGLMEMADKAFRAMAQSEAIPLPDGKILKEVSSTRYKASPDAGKFILNAYNPETLIACSEVKLSGLDAGIRAGLEQAGLIETVPFKQLRAVRPKEK